MRAHRSLPAFLTAVLLASSPARGADVALAFGAIEVIALPPAHAGFYPFVGVSFAFATKHVVFIGSLSLEVSFDQGRGGLVGGLTADFPLNERLGLDLNVTLIHDQPGLRFSESVFYAGAGPGVSIFLGKWTISPSVSLFAGLSAPGWSVVPGVNVARTF